MSVHDRPPRRGPRQVAARLVERLGPMLWVLVLLVAGGAALVGGGFAVDDDYLAGVMLEIGAGLFIAVPLIVLERLLEGRISDARTEAREGIDSVRSEVEGVARDVRDTRLRVDELGAATRRQIDAARAADAEGLRALRDDVSQGNTLRVLRRAQALGAVDAGGVRVAMPGCGMRLRFAPAAGDAVELTVEEPGGEPLARERWDAGEPTDGVLARLAEALQVQGRYPGDESFDAEAIFGLLADAVDATTSVRTNGRAGEPLGAAVELVGPWVVSARGLEHLHDHARAVDSDRLLADPEGAGAALRGDDDDGALERALAAALDYHVGRRRRAARDRVPRPAGAP